MRLGIGNDDDFFNIPVDEISFWIAPDFEHPLDGNEDNAYRN